MVEVLEFCEENLNNYEKNMLRLMIIYGEYGVINLSDADVCNLSALLNIESNKIKKALKLTEGQNIFQDTKIRFGDELVMIGDVQDYVFIDIILRFSFVSENLRKITYGNDKESLFQNIKIFNYIAHDFEMINANASTFECMYKGFYTLEYVVHSDGDFSPIHIIRLLELIASFDEYYESVSEILPIIYHLLWYELHTRTNTLYLICIVQIIKHSDLFEECIQGLADELYEYLMFLLRNARIVSVQVNLLYQDIEKPYELRTRVYDNTTRLNILYSYNNYDAYSIRLDLEHQGEGFVHYNNISPGGIKCCLFTEDEYLAIIDDNLDASDYFIEYGNRYALKELINLQLTKEEKKQYDSIRILKEHDQALKKLYTEKSIEEFISLLANMLPAYCHVPIDKDGYHADCCFKYSKLMSEMHVLSYGYLYSRDDCLDRLISNIVEKAVRHGFVDGTEKELYMSLDGIRLLIEVVKKNAIAYE